MGWRPPSPRSRSCSPASGAERARTAAIPGEWSVQEIADHVLETHRAGLDELRCLLAGRRPPGEAIPAGLQSRAPLLRPWPWLLSELGRVHADILEALRAAPDADTGVSAPIVMVVNVPGEGGAAALLQWIEECDWKAYAIVWRLHAMDHLNQVRRVLAAG